MDDTVRAPPDPDATSVHLAWLRTRMAVERTLMAWLRTSTALLTFGFGLVQFFDWFYKSEGTRRSPAPRPQGHRSGPLRHGHRLASHTRTSPA